MQHVQAFWRKYMTIAITNTEMKTMTTAFYQSKALGNDIDGVI